MSPHAILSNAQREAILAAQFDLDEREVDRYWTSSDQDLLRNDRRRDSNRFGLESISIPGVMQLSGPIVLRFVAGSLDTSVETSPPTLH